MQGGSPERSEHSESSEIAEFSEISEIFLKSGVEGVRENSRRRVLVRSKMRGKRGRAF